jgi:DNA-binding XRE family transcriptional regulator
MIMAEAKPRFRELRIRAGYKSARLSRESGVSPSSLYRIETGEKVTPELVQQALNVINRSLGTSYTAYDLEGVNL